MKSTYVMMFAFFLLYGGCTSSTNYGPKVNAEKLEKFNSEQKQKQKIEQQKWKRDNFDFVEVEQYFITIQVKESHFTLDPGVWIKDDINATTFSIPTSKEFYNCVSVGHMLNDSFRDGSFWFDGNFGNWHVKITNKYVKKVKIKVPKIK